jgi:hypothetical protein
MLADHPIFVVFLVAVLAPLVAQTRLGSRMPVVVFEVVLGMVIGPQVLKLVADHGFLAFMREVGMVAVMFMAGMEIDFARIRGRPLALGASRLAGLDRSQCGGAGGAASTAGSGVAAHAHHCAGDDRPGHAVADPARRRPACIAARCHAAGRRHGRRGRPDRCRLAGALEPVQQLAGVRTADCLSRGGRTGHRHGRGAAAARGCLRCWRARCTPARSCRCAWRCCCWLR